MMAIVGRSLALLLLAAVFSVFVADGLGYTYQQREDSPEVYYINMDKSADRQVSMERHLEQIKLRHFRVRGLTPQEIYVPDDIEATWRYASCKLQTDWHAPNKYTENINRQSVYRNYTSYMATLCGRGKGKNTAKELGCTTSHLLAMRKAIYSTTARSRYALIIEDDVYFPFDVDFEALARSAPKGFGILQLFNSNENTMLATWDKYLRNQQYVWVERHPKKFFDFWSTCAYLIDRVAMKSVVDAVAYEHSGWMAFKVVAGINGPCVPAECCAPGTDNFIVKPPCVWAPRGYQADSFLYAMTKTYMLSMPLISNGIGGNRSTFHQDHVESVHRRAFKQQRTFINKMLSGEVPPPPFASRAAEQLLDVHLV